MMKMDADVVVMTMPDLETYHIKKSYIRKDVKYILVQHGIGSVNLTYRKGATDHYDIVFASGKAQYDEMIEFNKITNQIDRPIIKCGYPLIDEMINEYEETINKQKTILIAPSWQKDNIIDLCLIDILDNFKTSNYKVIVRPHPQHVRHMKEKFETMKEQYKNNKNIEIQTDFSSNTSILTSDILITDWSDIAYEFSFTTKKPVIFIDTPMKIMNPDYKEMDIEPFNIYARNEIGKVLKIDNIKEIKNVADDMIKNNKKYRQKITDFTKESLYNIGTSSEVGAKHIIKVVQNQIKKRKEGN